VDLLAFLAVVAILAAVVALVSAPLRSGARDVQAGAGAEVVALEAERDAKFREIRELELDARTGKLAEEDFAALDRALRAEAAEILARLDRAQAGSGHSAS